MALLALVLAQPLALSDETTPWEALERKDGLALSQRPVKGSPFREYRVEARTPVPAALSCDAVFDWATKGTPPTITRRKLLSDHGDERVMYDQFEHPLLSQRDYALTMVREHAADGSCTLRFWATNEKAPAAAAGTVRMAKLYGWWTFVPDGAQTKVTHVMFSDPAGAVPPIFVHGAQRSSALEIVQTGLKEAAAAQAREKAR
jgi:hypothetical protein